MSENSIPRIPCPCQSPASEPEKHMAAIRARPSLASVLLSEFLQAFSVAVRTFAEKGSGPLAEVEDLVAKTNRDGPFRKFRGRPQGKVAISSCGWPWNSYDIAWG